MGIGLKFPIPNMTKRIIRLTINDGANLGKR